MGNSPSQHQHQQHQHHQQNQQQHQQQPNTNNNANKNPNIRHHLAFQNQFRASPLSPSAGVGVGVGLGTAPSPSSTAASESQDYFSHQPLPHSHAPLHAHPHPDPAQVPQRLPPFKSQPIAIHPRNNAAAAAPTNPAAMAASPGNHATITTSTNNTHGSPSKHTRGAGASSLDQPFVGSPLSYASSIVTQHPGMMADDTALAELPENTHQLPVADDPTTVTAPSSATSPPLSPTSAAAAAAGNAPSALTAALRASAAPPSPTKPLSHDFAQPTPSATAALPPPSPARAPVTAVPASMLVPTTISYTHPPTSSSSSSTSASAATDPPPSAVFITGTFNAWRSKIPLRLQPPASPRSPAAPAAATFAVTLALAPGIYRFKFIVDDEWRCAPKLSTAQDEDGNLVNFIEVTAAATAAAPATTDTQHSRPRALTAPAPSPPAASASADTHSAGLAVPAGGSHWPAAATDAGGASGVHPSHVRTPSAAPVSSSVPTPSRQPQPAPSDSAPHSYQPTGVPGLTALSESPPASYTSHIPTSQSLVNLAALSLHPPTTSTSAPVPLPPTGTFAVTQGPDGQPVLDPPALPAHLTKVVLNQVKAEDQSLPVPPHVSLNHLYACSIKDGVMAVAVTGRYRKKCVTTVVYRPVNI